MKKLFVNLLEFLEGSKKSSGPYFVDIAGSKSKEMLECLGFCSILKNEF